jgi:hypothetical protein
MITVRPDFGTPVIAMLLESCYHVMILPQAASVSRKIPVASPGSDKPLLDSFH